MMVLLKCGCASAMLGASDIMKTQRKHRNFFTSSFFQKKPFRWVGFYDFTTGVCNMEDKHEFCREFDAFLEQALEEQLAILDTLKD